MTNVKELAKAVGIKPAKEPKEKEELFLRKSFVDCGEELAQQIYDPRKKISKYLLYHKGGTTAIVDEVVDDAGIKYKPLMGDELEEDIVLLPTELDSYGDIKTLVNEIQAHIHKYTDIDLRYERYSAWYVLLTWVYDRFHTINYLRVLGDTGCGKTRYLDVVGGLCYNATKGSGATSVAAIKRITQKWKGTMVVDEGDFKDSDEKNELVKYFNLGFERSSPMMNCDKNDPSKLEFFKPYCPKIIATRQTFKDKALEARCLTHVMYQMTREGIPIILPNNFPDEQLVIRNKLLKFRLENYRKINTEYFDIGVKVEPRLLQGTYSFGSMLQHDPDALEEFKGFILEYQKELIEERATSFEGLIVNTIYGLLEEEQENVTSKMVADTMTAAGYETKPATIGKRLKALGIGTYQKKIEGKKLRVILFDKIKWGELEKRYIADLNKDLKVPPVPVVPIHTSTGTQKQAKLTEEATNTPQHYINKKSLMGKGVDGTTGTFGTAGTENTGVNESKSDVSVAGTAGTENEKVTYENVYASEKLPWEPHALVYQQCKICGDVPCNFNAKNLPICEKHWGDNNAA